MILTKKNLYDTLDHNAQIIRKIVASDMEKVSKKGQETSLD